MYDACCWEYKGEEENEKKEMVEKDRSKKVKKKFLG